MRTVQKRAVVIEDDVARLRFDRRSVAAHEAAWRRRTSFLRRSKVVHRASRRASIPRHRHGGLAWRWLVTAEEQLVHDAAAHGVTFGTYPMENRAVLNSNSLDGGRSRARTADLLLVRQKEPEYAIDLTTG